MKYIYHGPSSGITLRVDGKDVETLLTEGGEIELPAEHPAVKTLIALKRLEAAKTDETGSADAAAVATSTASAAASSEGADVVTTDPNVDAGIPASDASADATGASDNSGTAMLAEGNDASADETAAPTVAKKSTTRKGSSNG